MIGKSIDTIAAFSAVLVISILRHVTLGSGYFVTVTDYPDPNVTQKLQK